MNVYKHKPTMVSAFRWNGHKFRLDENVSEMERRAFSIHDNGNLTVHNSEGTQVCSIGDYVIRAGINDFYVCPNLKFDANYMIVDEDYQ